MQGYHCGLPNNGETQSPGIGRVYGRRDRPLLLVTTLVDPTANPMMQYASTSGAVRSLGSQLPTCSWGVSCFTTAVRFFCLPAGGARLGDHERPRDVPRSFQDATHGGQAPAPGEDHLETNHRGRYQGEGKAAHSARRPSSVTINSRSVSRNAQPQERLSPAPAVGVTAVSTFAMA